MVVLAMAIWAIVPAAWWTAAANDSSRWVALKSAKHSLHFTACAQTDGGPCAPHSNISLMDSAQHSWWNGSTTGDEICERLGLPK